MDIIIENSTITTERFDDTFVQNEVLDSEIGDFNSTCRICATSSSQVWPIFEGECQKHHLAFRIHTYLPQIKLNKSDLLPQTICEWCMRCILTWHSLVQRCNRADRALRTRLANAPTSTTHSTEAVPYDPAFKTAYHLNTTPTDPINSTSLSNEIAVTTIDTGGDIKLDLEVPSTSDQVNPFLNENEIRWNSYHFDGGPDPPGPDDGRSSDDEPLVGLANRKTANLYDAFYRALLNFKEHFSRHHRTPDDDDSADSAEDERSETDERPRGPAADASIDEYDDLSRLNMRRDRLAPAERQAVARALALAPAGGGRGRGRYACECGKRLGSAHTFLAHRRIHTGERPCVCHECGAQFRAGGALRRHLAAAHARRPRARPTCRLCRRSFANAQNLRHHARVHSGERPFACAACPRRFAHSGSLHAHRRAHARREAAAAAAATAAATTAAAASGPAPAPALAPEDC